MPTHHQLPLGLTLISVLTAISAIGCGVANEPPADAERGITSESASSGEPDTRQSACVLPSGRRTFDQSKSPEARAEVRGCVPAFSAEQVSAAFAAIRDTRALSVPEQPDFGRRITWMLPDNGCEPRANQAAYWLEQWGYPRPYFARATGKLGLDTANDVRGQVRWSGHVAPLVRIDAQLIVLDPAVNPNGPLPLSEWLARITLPGSSSEFALCQEYALKDDCFAADPGPLSISNLYDFLHAEWLNEKMLGRDPTQTLGSCPTWLGCAPPDAAGDPSLPPIIEKITQSEYDFELAEGYPTYVIGNNFIAGLTTLQITGNGIDRSATTQGTVLRRMIITDDLPAGTYQVTAANGDHTSPAATMIVPL